MSDTVSFQQVAWPDKEPMRWPQALDKGDIHCWLFSLDRDDDESLLSQEERARAAKFHFARDQRRFIAGRAARRRILAGYLGALPAQLAFDEGAQGRPFLGDHDLNFNMSRSNGWGLVAISESNVLGVDIEAVSMSDDLRDVAVDNFSPAERGSLGGLCGDIWVQGFFNCWTRKEAVVKAVGQGLSMPLDCFDVTLAPDARAQILRADGEAQEARAWSLTAFNPLDGYCAAIASDIAAPNLHFFQLNAPDSV